jgi:carboxypeptidase Q
MKRSTRLALAFLPVALVLACSMTPPPAPDRGASRALAAPVATAPVPTSVAMAVEAAPEAAAKSTLERLIELGRTDNRVQDHLHHLCLEIGPRLTSSTRLQEACEWTRAEFERFGLKASLERWGEFPVGFDRGAWSGGMVAPESVPFEFHTMSWTPGTDGPKRGRALAYPKSKEELAGLALAGAWLVRPPANGLKDASGATVFEKPDPPSNDLVEAVQAALLAQGGLGEVRGARSELLVTDGRHEIAWDALPKLVSIRVVKSQHEELWRRLVVGEPVELEFDVDNRFVQGPIPQFNVIADLVGSEKPDEYVIVGGHIDSWDGAQGTVDNGTGCATTLEAARLLVAAGARPKRTIRFMLWSGEEQGLFGSEAWVKAHPELHAKISVVLVHDEGTNYLSGLGVPAAMMTAMQVACAPLATLDPEFPFELAQVEGLPSSVGSDNDSFVRAGVPGLFWRQSGRSEYEHYHHTQHDVFEAAVPEYQRHSAMVAAITALGVADLPELLDRKEMKSPEARRMGVQLDGTKVTEVSPDGRAAAAGVQVGDVLLAIDGTETKTQNAVTGAVRGGGSTKLVKVQRGEATLELTLDWSKDPDEPRRLKQLEARAARDAARKAEREAKQAAEAAPAEGSKP